MVDAPDLGRVATSPAEIGNVGHVEPCATASFGGTGTERSTQSDRSRLRRRRPQERSFMKRLGVALIATIVCVLSGDPAGSASAHDRESATVADSATALGALALFMNAPTVEGLAMSAVGSPAYVYLDSVRLIAANGLFEPANFSVSGDTLVQTGGTTLSNLVLDAQGLIVGLSRQGRPVSETVFPIYQVVEGTDEGAGVTGTIHSVRYFDGNLQFVTLTENHSNVEAYISVDEYVSAGQQLTNVFASPVRPTIVNANLDIFEGAPEDGGTGYGHIWADGIGVVEFEVAVPPAGTSSPTTTAPASATATAPTATTFVEEPAAQFPAVSLTALEFLDLDECHAYEVDDAGAPTWFECTRPDLPNEPAVGYITESSDVVAAYEWAQTVPGFNENVAVLWTIEGGGIFYLHSGYWPMFDLAPWPDLHVVDTDCAPFPEANPNLCR